MTASFPSPEALRQTAGPSAITVAVIDYGCGNVQSVRNALEAIGATVVLSREKEDLVATHGLILPGVGAFGDGMAALHRYNLVSLLTDLVVEQQKPFLGICLGMQLMARKGFEHGAHAGLGWMDAEVVRLHADNHPDPGRETQARSNPAMEREASATAQPAALKIPHVGWNDVTVCAPAGEPEREINPLLGAPGETRSYYFVHSYQMQCGDPADVSGVCDYGGNFTAAVRKGNLFGVQFHPEKSQKHGLKLLENFLHYAATESPPC